ncbi:hypothetical protein BDR26DRAFT_931150 [Obelidium mucronatum]|nr:hypothetical protein BDR26DRAFT_931150 [Obelidium mucronatum]
MPFSKSIAKAASEQNVIIAGALFFVSYSLLKRSNAAFFPDNALAFAPDWAARYGYSADEVMATNINELYLIAPSPLLVSWDHSVITWAAESLGKVGKSFLIINQLPAFNAVQHIGEAVLFTAAILTQNAEFAAYAGTISQMRSIMSLGCVVLTAIASAQFLRVWIKSIGRDGRQKIEKKE